MAACPAPHHLQFGSCTLARGLTRHASPHIRPTSCSCASFAVSSLRRDLHPQERAHAARHTKRNWRIEAPVLFLIWPSQRSCLGYIVHGNSGLHLRIQEMHPQAPFAYSSPCGDVFHDLDQAIRWTSQPHRHNTARQHLAAVVGDHPPHVIGSIQTSHLIRWNRSGCQAHRQGNRGPAEVRCALCQRAGTAARTGRLRRNGGASQIPPGSCTRNLITRFTRSPTGCRGCSRASVTIPAKKLSVSTFNGIKSPLGRRTSSEV